MRKATVEIDKVVTTEWPPDQVEKDGQLHSLAGIYAAAGMELTVTYDQADLPLPPTGPDFDLPSLHEYMTRHRRADRDGWYAHILVVPNIEYAEGWQISRPLGVMYDFRSSDLNNMPREGCAMSMRAVSASPLIYMRTLAHELGHVFNLLHPKHEIPPQPIGTSIMNQTMDLQNLGGFPGNIQYDFSAANKAWLAHGPAEFVRPGGRPFSDRPDDAGELVRDEILPATAGLTLEVSTRSASFELGEPVYLRVTLRNDGQTPVEVNSLLSLASSNVDVWITTPKNREFRFRPALTTCDDSRPVLLPPGQEILASEPIFFGARGHSFPGPGVYKIRARYQSTVKGQALHASAKLHSIEVKPATSAADIDVADAMASPSAALYLILRGGAHLRGAEATLRRVVERSPTRAVAQHARLAMAAQALTPEFTNVTKANQLLEGLKPDVLDRTHRAEYERLRGLASACSGDHQGMDRALKQFEELATKSRPEPEHLVQDTLGWIEGIGSKQRR